MNKIIILSFCLFVNNTYASTFQDWLNAIKQNNPQWQAQKRQENIAQAQLQKAQSLKDFKVTLKADISEVITDKKSFERLASSLIATYPLIDDKISSKKTIAEQTLNWRKQQSQASLLAQMIKFVKITNKYWQALIDLSYSQQQQKQTQQQIELAQRRLTTGSQALSTIGALKLKKAKWENKAWQNKENIETLKAKFTSLTTNKYLDAPDLPKNMPNKISKILAIKLNDWLKKLPKHPELKSLISQSMLLKSKADDKLSNEKLAVNGFGSLVINDSGGNFYDDMKGLRFGIQMSLPIYTGDFAENEALIEYQKSAQTLSIYKAKLENFSSQVKQYYYQMEALKNSRYSYQNILSLAKNLKKINQANIASGQQNALASLQTQQDIIKAQWQLDLFKLRVWNTHQNFFLTLGNPEQLKEELNN